MRHGWSWDRGVASINHLLKRPSQLSPWLTVGIQVIKQAPKRQNQVGIVQSQPVMHLNSLDQFRLIKIVKVKPSGFITYKWGHFRIRGFKELGYK